jgi:type II secretory pathway pseudopilin PulG
MRDFGIVALLSVIATAAAPTAPSAKVETYLTAKSTQQFAGCYAEVQKQRYGAALWYVPNATGGAFSGVGGPDGRQPYFIRINDRGSQREIFLQGAIANGPEARGVSQCI